MTNLGTLWRTVRHLRAEQVIGRVRFRLLRPTPDLRPAPPRRAPVARWIPSFGREASLLGPSTMGFLNETHDIDHVGWDDPTIGKLWRYNLHYFDDLNAQGSEVRSELQHRLLERWIAENPPASGTGWEPYPTSLRIVNWIKWFLRGHARTLYIDSLAVQTRWLMRRIEFHLMGNHLFANAKALVFSGVFFRGPEGEAWLQRGLELVEREMREQVLDDGGHFERSPMYHALMLEDVLDLLNVFRTYAVGPSTLIGMLEVAAPKMLLWLRCMCHPDGTYAYFNDCAQGIAPTREEIDRYASALGVMGSQPREGVTRLPQSGYVRFARGAGTAIFDVAEVGPDYLPGHAHADTLSLEFSLGGRRIIVNGGTSCYGVGEQRLRERGTSAHSTVQINSENSSEVWSGFRVGRRARPFGYAQSDWSACCSHDGYRFMPGCPAHRRCVEIAAGELKVADEVSVAGLRSVARYILSPGLELRQSSDGRWEVLEKGVVLVVIDVCWGRPARAAATHAPRFGILLPVECLEVELVDGRASTRWLWNEDAYPVSH